MSALLSELAARCMPHLMLAPIGLPLLTAALTLLMGEERQRVKLALNIVSTALGLLVAVALLRWAHHVDTPADMGVYLQGNWIAPFGIVLVLDRLSALMLVLTMVLALCCVVFAGTRWHRAGVHFHALFQLQLMGLAGAFLTGDLFNLFVFFEIMLAASYGLLLHGSGRARVQSGLHYIAVNLAASSLFLIGAAMLYGITGTLNMADLAQQVPHVAAADRGLLHAAAAILATAFLIKAAVWPLNFWLVPAYSAATAPVGALFAVMTKVGVYTLLRLWTLLFGSEAGASALFGGLWLVGAGMATMAFGAIGMLASQRLAHLAGFAAVLSSGTVLAASGLGQNQLTAAMLYYLPGSTLAIGALFLLADLIERWRTDGTDLRGHDGDEAPFLTPELVPTPGLNLDDEEQVLVGRAIPAGAAVLGLAYLVCTLVIAGMPPLSGFVGKFAMLNAVLNPLGLESSAGTQPGGWGWTLLALLIGTGLLSLIALTRTGMRHFWAAHDRQPPRLHVFEGLPLAALLAACVALALRAELVMAYTEATANGLHAPANYVRAVLQAQPIPGPVTPPGSQIRPGTVKETP
ncbi:monovalent cation/H+ antiporter subunit D [Melaminivora sp.]|uniref:monovalent cation/H+ antiporter subunit D n=1 Tax=Melaminivora sp. TaxID=1933032 RepID=UPI0028A9384D|nr:monovalent cation/H+ antiporter subunit D [Melaminivora sp.]